MIGAVLWQCVYIIRVCKDKDWCRCPIHVGHDHRYDEYRETKLGLALLDKLHQIITRHCRKVYRGADKRSSRLLFSNEKLRSALSFILHQIVLNSRCMHMLKTLCLFSHLSFSQTGMTESLPDYRDRTEANCGRWELIQNFQRCFSAAQFLTDRSAPSLAYIVYRARSFYKTKH